MPTLQIVKWKIIEIERDLADGVLHDRWGMYTYTYWMSCSGLPELAAIFIHTTFGFAQCFFTPIYGAAQHMLLVIPIGPLGHQNTSFGRSSSDMCTCLNDLIVNIKINLSIRAAKKFQTANLSCGFAILIHFPLLKLITWQAMPVSFTNFSLDQMNQGGTSSLSLRHSVVFTGNWTCS